MVLCNSLFLRPSFRKNHGPDELKALKLAGIIDRTKGPLWYPRGMERVYGWCIEVWYPWDNIETLLSGNISIYVLVNSGISRFLAYFAVLKIS